ncbi:MAG: LPS export ABC transporter periplasmic protein LptC [Bacteroidales bacterium]|nr:LPS export ABC transporter periplasmic protein LptC [Bacteroidales bacterium]
MKLLTKTAVQVIPLIMGMTFMLSCRTKIEKIDKIDNPDTIPTQLATDISIMVSDSGYVRINIVSPELRDFEVPDSLDPKTEFPKGLVATFYNHDNQIESTLVAGYAIYHINTQLFEATKDVVIKNLIENQELHTQLLWWDQANEKIWSDQPITIITPEGITHGNSGFQSDQSFSKYDIFNSSGQMTVTEPAKH